MNTCNLSNNPTDFYNPKVSSYTNNVYNFTETRLIAVRNVIGLSSLEFYYFTGDGYNINTETENHYLSVNVFSMSNVSVLPTSMTGGTYYNVVCNGIVSSTNNYYFFKLMISYKFGGATHIENLGYTEMVFNESHYTVGWSQYYNNYFSKVQDYHRKVIDTNERTSFICDIKTPLYLNGTTTTFTIKYALYNSDLNFGTDNLYSFKMWIYIKNTTNIYYTGFSSGAVGKTQPGFLVGETLPAIGSITFNANLNALGIKELTSYVFEIKMQSNEPKGLMTTRVVNVYVDSLYYVFINYIEHRTEVIQMSDLIETLKVKSDITQGVYTAVTDIINTMKSKINSLDSAIDKLNHDSKVLDRQYKLVKDSISYFKDYYVHIKNDFIDSKKASDVAKSGTDFTTFKGYLEKINMWYADSFAQYNAFIAYMKGENQIGDDFGNASQGYRDEYKSRYMEDLKGFMDGFLPGIILMVVLLMSLMISLLIYYVFRNKTKNKYYLYVLCIIVFTISAIVLYMALLSISTSIVYWLNGV